CARQDSNLDCW
nr:immunoglobulin heavy chain junction region [Macaca mulatta]